MIHSLGCEPQNTEEKREKAAACPGGARREAGSGDRNLQSPLSSIATSRGFALRLIFEPGLTPQALHMSRLRHFSRYRSFGVVTVHIR